MKGRRKLNKDRVLTAFEKKRRFDDKAASIDEQLDEAWLDIDWDRRNKAELNLAEWINTYMLGLTLDDPPPEHGIEVLNQMQRAITSHSNYMCELARGSGKSCYAISTVLYAIATGKQDFVVLVANNARAASGLLNDMWRVFQETDTLFAQDYPELALPFALCNGSFRRKQLYKGQSTDLKKTSTDLVFATLNDEKFKHSGAVVAVRGITSGIRGLKHGTKRPSFVLLDDLQTTESASNPEQVQKLVESIQKDIFPLAGKKRLSILQLATPICPEDLVQKIREDKSWTTTIFPAVISYPKNMDLWKQYFQKYDEETVAQTSHTESLDFYKANRQAMDEGSEVFNPTRFSTEDGHISAIQKLLEIHHTIGDEAFASEYQMNPRALQFALPITPNIVASRKSTLKELEVPDENVQFVVASSDLNLGKYITTTIVVFKRDQTATIIYHKFRKCHIPLNIPEQDYFKRVYNLLGEHGKELKSLGIRIDGLVIDGNGQPFKPVQEFCKHSKEICGIPAAAFIGKASHAYRSYFRSRLKEDVNRTLLCGDEDEHKKAGSGHKYTYWDSDYYREMLQKSFLQEAGNIGSIAFYDGIDHTEWALQICNERLLLKRQRSDGQWEYTWKSTDPHDALDSLAQALAAYASQGFSTGDTGRMSMSKARFKLKKRQYKII